MLLAVFGFIMLMGFFVVQFLEIVALQVRRQSLESSADDLRPHAVSALETTLAVLAEFREIDGAIYGPAQGWEAPLDYAGIPWPEGITVEVTITDEGSLLPLNGVVNDDTRERLRNLFDELEIDEAELYEVSGETVAVLTESLIDWIDADERSGFDGGEADWYEDRNWPRLPPNRPLTRLEDLRYIRGWRELFFDTDGAPNERFEAFRPHVTLFEGGKVNINTASETLLYTALERLGEYFAEDLVDERNGPDGVAGTADDEVFTTLAEAGLGDDDNASTEMSLIRVEVLVRAAYGQYRIETLVNAGGSSGSAGDGGGGARNPGGNPPDTRTGSRSGGGSASGGYPFEINRRVDNLSLD